MPQKITLPNGVTLVTETRKGTGRVSMQVHIKAGTLHESVAENGLTFLTQESFSGGTKTLSRAQLAEKIEALGSSLSSGTDSEATHFSSTALSRHAGTVFRTLADMVINPALAADEIKKTKELIRQGLTQEEQSPARQASLRFQAAALAGQGAGLNPMGTAKNLAAFTPEQVRQKHKELLAHPENIVISITGDIDPAEAEKLVAETFGALPGAAAARPVPPVTFTGGDARKAEANDQTQIRLGFRVPLAAEEDRYIVQLLREYLAGGMSAPLFQEVREKRGLVYDVGARYTAIGNERIFSIVAGAGAGNAGELIDVAVGLFGDILRNGIPAEALDQARARLIRSVESQLESAETTGWRHAGHILDYGRAIPLEEIRAQLARVTSDDIRRIIAGMMSGPYALAAVGPQETMPTQEAIKALLQKQLDGVAVPQTQKKSALPPFAETAQKAAPAEGKPKITILPNGLKVVTIERPGTLACGAWVGAGADHETAALNGATHMNEHMMFKGTPSYGPGEIDKIVENEFGGGLNAYTSRDVTAYYFYNLEHDALDKVTDICGEMVFKANIDQEEFNGKNGRKGERDVVIEEIRRSNDNVNDALWDALQQTAYPDQPSGRPILGTEQTLRAFTAAQLAAYRDAYYAPNNVVFAAVGPIRHEDFVAAVEQKFGNLKAGNVPPLPKPAYKGGVVHVVREAATLCNVALAVPAAATVDKEADVYEVLAAVLGTGASSRLYQRLVMEKGLTSDIGAAQQSYRNGGMFYIYTSVDAKKLKPLLAAIYEEIHDLAQTLTQAELDKAKAALEMDLLGESETNSDACDTLGADVLAHGKIRTTAEKSAALQGVTLADVKRAAQEILRANPTLSTVVPAKTSLKSLPTEKDVHAMRDAAAAGTAKKKLPPPAA